MGRTSEESQDGRGAPNGVRRSILLVEDDTALAEMYRFALQRGGHAVTIVATGQEALDAATADEVDLVILDIGLPDMDGLTVLERLRAAPAARALPVIMLTNYDEPEYVSRSLALGAAHYAVKAETPPNQLDALIARLPRPGGGDL